MGGGGTERQRGRLGAHQNVPMIPRAPGTLAVSSLAHTSTRATTYALSAPASSRRIASERRTGAPMGGDGRNEKRERKERKREKEGRREKREKEKREIEKREGVEKKKRERERETRGLSGAFPAAQLPHSLGSPGVTFAGERRERVQERRERNRAGRIPEMALGFTGLGKSLTVGAAPSWRFCSGAAPRPGEQEANEGRCRGIGLHRE